MASHTEIETAKPVTGKTVTSTLQNHSLRAIPIHDMLDDRLKNALVRSIIDAVAKREIDGVVFTLPNANISQLASAWEILAVLVKRNGHDPISGVERLLDTITMVNVNINVEDTLFETQELNDTQYNVYEA